MRLSGSSFPPIRRIIIFKPLFEPPACVAGFDDVAVVTDSIQQRRGHLFVMEDIRPFGERQVGGDDQGSCFVELADAMEQQPRAILENGR